jgi:hypothetical protein
MRMTNDNLAGDETGCDKQISRESKFVNTNSNLFLQQTARYLTTITAALGEVSDG